MIRSVYFYRKTWDDGTDEIFTLCKACANHCENIELIDKAGDFDECNDCEAQNVPAWYKHDKFLAGTFN